VLLLIKKKKKREREKRLGTELWEERERMEETNGLLPGEEGHSPWSGSQDERYGWGR
jgi:hypothetical protein